MCRWTCESCGGPIEDVDHGWVEWLYNRRTNTAKGLRLVHHRCYGPRAISGPADHYLLDMNGCCYSTRRDDDFDVRDHHLRVFIADGKPDVDRLKSYGPGLDLLHLHKQIAAGLSAGG
jgi:hypothetical protein